MVSLQHFRRVCLPIAELTTLGYLLVHGTRYSQGSEWLLLKIASVKDFLSRMKLSRTVLGWLAGIDYLAVFNHSVKFLSAYLVSHNMSVVEFPIDQS